MKTFSRRILTQTRRIHGSNVLFWNPFKKKPVLESGEAIDTTLVSIKQQLHQKNGIKDLTQMLSQLQTTSPTKHSFALMNEVIKKLDKSATNQDIIPGLAIDQCFDLYSHVIHTITPENYRSARFIPRLYLQITKRALELDNKELLLSTLGLFLQYLSQLGYEDQLIKVLDQFHKEFGLITKDTVIEFITVSEALHPSLLVRLFEMNKCEEMYQMSIDKCYQFVQADNSSIDKSDLAAIRLLIDVSTHYNYNNNVLKICESIVQFHEEEINFLQHTLTKNVYPIEDTYLITKSALRQSHRTDVKQWSESLASKSEFPAIMSLVWELHQFGLTSEVETELIKEGGCITDGYFELMIIALMNSPFTQQYTQLIECLEDIGFETSVETYTNLMEHYIQTRDIAQLKKVFDDSMKDGVDWSHASVLNKFFTVIAEQETNAKEVFQYSRRVKVHLNYLNPEAYNAFVVMLLKNRFIEDVVESFKQELPVQEGKYKLEDYPQLYDTLLQWFTHESEDGEDAHTIYKGFIQYFEVPGDWYFPLIQRLTHYDRPDLAFELFQDMKRIHRTTGAIAPPAPEVYIHLFKQFGRHTYADGVETLDAIYKVDLTINSSLPLLNSIMDAYCSLMNLTKVSLVYEQIINTSGPNNETVSIMLKAHTLMSLQNVTNYWNNLDQLGILPNGENYERYIIAHCYHNQPQKALEIAKQMEEMDVEVSPKLLKTLYQWTKEEDVKWLIEEWALEEHKDQWNTIKDELKQIEAIETPKSLEELGPTQEELRLMRS